MKSEIAIRKQAVRLRPGEEVVTAPRRELHRLRTQLADMKRRGEIVNAYNWTEAGQEVGVIILRNPAYRRRVKPAHVRAAGMVFGFVLGATVLGLLWEARNILAMGAALVALLAVIGVVLHVAFGGGSGCSCVVHGKACR